MFMKVKRWNMFDEDNYLKTIKYYIYLYLYINIYI